jgi:HEAT repeat protein
MYDVRKKAFRAASLLILPLACSFLCSCAPQGSAEGGAGPSVEAEPLAMLIGALQDKDPVVRADAARLLGDLRAREAIDPLVKYVSTDRRYNKTAGLDALARIGDPAVCPRIRPLVDEPLVPDDGAWYGRGAVRVAAAIALLSLGDESGAPFLKHLVADSNEGDRAWDSSLWALYTWFAPTVLALPDTLPTARVLKQGITFERVFPKDKKDPGQIVVICRTLGMMGTEQSLGKLVELLGFHSRYVRASAAGNLLKASPTREHIDAVTKLAEADPTEFVRIKAALALALAGEDKYVPNLVKAARSAADDLDRAAAVESLGLLGRRENAPLLLGLLRSADPFLRLSAVEALDRLGGGRVVALEVATCLRDENVRVRLCAAKFMAARKAEEKIALPAAGALKVGVASCDISPPEPTLLTPTGMGHSQPTRGLLDPLCVRALAIQAGGETAFVVIGDQLFSNRDTEVAVGQAVAKELGCNPMNVLITATHNHSSGLGLGANSGDAGKKAQADGRRKVTDGYIQACLTACKNLRPAEIAASTVWLKEPIGINRRMTIASGAVMTNWGGTVAVPGDKFYGRNPDSTRIDVLSIREPGKTAPFAILTSYASHIHLTGIPYYGSEFAGAARQAIESRVPGAMVVYANSTAGDISIASPLATPLVDGNSEEMLRFHKDTLAIMGKRFADAVVPSIPSGGYLRPVALRHGADTYPYGGGQLSKLNVLVLDNIALAAIPGEMFSQFGDLMHERSPLGNLLLLGYGGGTAGYVPPVVGYEQGGYEMRGAIAQGTRGLDIVSKLTEILEQLVSPPAAQAQTKPGIVAKRE